MEQAVVIQSISKSYEDVQALTDISLNINRGELFGLIGPDGAGKTTLFRILTTLLLADKGHAQVEGLDVIKDYKEIRKITGYMAGRFSLYQDLTVEENMNFYATVFGTTIEENYDLVKDIYSHIEPFKNRRAGKLSGGMKQKLALSCALIHKPRILVLDEPTTGVDAVSRKEFWEMLIRLKEYHITILVSTPYMDEAELCDRVALIQDGHILSVDTPGAIISNYQHRLLAVRAKDIYRLKQDLEVFEGTMSVFLFGQDLHLSLNESGSEKKLESFMLEKEHSQISIKQISPNIEDCFLDLMAKSG
ncbi:ABC transporter ATP-binding protein [Bacteroidota bacterium]